MTYELHEPPRCRSCGVPWYEHRGTEPQCKELQAAKAKLAKVSVFIERETKDCHHDEFWRGKQSALGQIYAILNGATE